MTGDMLIKLIMVTHHHVALIEKVIGSKVEVTHAAMAIEIP